MLYQYRDIDDGANELRLLLCKKKTDTSPQSVVSAAGNALGFIVFAPQMFLDLIFDPAGIYVKDIVRAAPIVKYFDLFKSVGTLISVRVIRLFRKPIFPDIFG